MDIVEVPSVLVSGGRNDGLLAQRISRPYWAYGDNRRAIWLLPVISRKLAYHLVLSQPRNRKGLEAKGRTDGLGPSLRKSVWVIVIWRLTEY